MRTFHNMLLFSLFGLSLWFFGNLYEGIVIAPNLLTHAPGKIQHWQAFFSITNPLFFYIPLAPLAIMTLLVIYKQTNQQQTELKSHLKTASIFVLLAFVLGIYIISQLNFKLFFGDPNQPMQAIFQLSLWWNILNAIRVVLIGISVYHVFKAYIVIHRIG